MHSRLKSWLTNLALMAAGLVVACLLCEVLLRVLGFNTSRFEAYGEIPFKYRADLRFYNRKENPNWVALNNWGFHDRQRDAEAPGYRILLLGDSFVEGLQVEVDGLFSNRLEENLRQAGMDAEVLNAGLGGIGTAHEYLLWRDFFRDRIRIDRVVLFFCNGNDLSNNHPVLERKINGNEVENKAYVKPGGDVFVVPRAPSHKPFVDRLSSTSVLASTLRRNLYLLKKSLKRRRAPAPAPEQSSPEKQVRQETPPPDPEVEAAWEEAISGTLRLIERWHAELHESGLEFSVVAMPWADHQPDNPYGYPHKAAFVTRLAALAAERGFDLLELRYDGHEPLDIFSFDGKTLGHFNPEGHALVARQLGEWIRAGVSAGAGR